MASKTTLPTLAAVLMAWFAATLTALWAVEAYKATPGDVGPTPVIAPVRLGIAERTGRPRLLMFVHPKCSCSQASLSELAGILAEEPGTADAAVVFVKPDGATGNWDQTPLRAAAAQLSAVSVLSDDLGAQAQQFCAKTSGHVVLYDARDTLRFSGGITRSRGHAGDNAGRRSLLAALRHQPVEQPETPVFGCPLFAPQACCRLAVDSHPER